MLVSVLFPDQTSRVALPTLRFTSPMFGFHFWICMCSSSLRCFFLLSQGSIMPNSNRVPRPYFFDDPAGEDADSGVPWVNQLTSTLKVINCLNDALELGHWDNTSCLRPVTLLTRTNTTELTWPSIWHGAQYRVEDAILDTPWCCLYAVKC